MACSLPITTDASMAPMRGRIEAPMVIGIAIISIFLTMLEVLSSWLCDLFLLIYLFIVFRLRR